MSLPRSSASSKSAISTNVPIAIPADLSFIFVIRDLSPNFDVQPNLATSNPQGFWLPPNRRNAFHEGTSKMFRYLGGRVSELQNNDPVRAMNLTRHSVATVFTQNPDTPHILAVNFDATEINVADHSQWRVLSFNHERVSPNSSRCYSSINITGHERHLAAPGSLAWVPQLIPQWYDFQPQTTSSSAVSAGLTGNLPILLALAAFSAPLESLVAVLTNNIWPGRWIHHTNPPGNTPFRGMVVKVCLDPSYPAGSTIARLDQLQHGVFGPFYGP